MVDEEGQRDRIVARGSVELVGRPAEEQVRIKANEELSRLFPSIRIFLYATNCDRVIDACVRCVDEREALW